MATPVKFGVGQSVLRKEDDALIRGKGRYTDDFAPSQALHALVLRSPHAHAKFTIDTARAKTLPGVALVLTAARHDWTMPRDGASAQAPHTGGRGGMEGRAAPPLGGLGGLCPPRPALLAGIVFTAVETGIESAAGIWGYVFLTSGRGLPPNLGVQDGEAACA